MVAISSLWRIDPPLTADKNLSKLGLSDARLAMSHAEESYSTDYYLIDRFTINDRCEDAIIGVMVSTASLPPILMMINRENALGEIATLRLTADC